MLRSTYASKDTPTYVELTFRCQQADYVVRRNPEYSAQPSGGQVGHRKGGCPVDLPRWPAPTGTREVTKAIEGIVVLDRTQFSRVAMLGARGVSPAALGENRGASKIFREIFHTGPYQQLQEALSARGRPVERGPMKSFLWPSTSTGKACSRGRRRRQIGKKALAGRGRRHPSLLGGTAATGRRKPLHSSGPGRKPYNGEGESPGPADWARGEQRSTPPGVGDHPEAAGGSGTGPASSPDSLGGGAAAGGGKPGLGGRDCHQGTGTAGLCGLRPTAAGAGAGSTPPCPTGSAKGRGGTDPACRNKPGGGSTARYLGTVRGFGAAKPASGWASPGAVRPEKPARCCLWVPRDSF